MDEIFFRNQFLNYAPPPRRGGNGIGRAIAWIVIVLSVALLLRMNWINSRNMARATAAPAARAGMQAELTGRYIIGVHALLARLGKPDTSAQALATQFDQAAKTSADKLGAVIIAAELLGKNEALERLKSMPASPTTAPAVVTTPAKAPGRHAPDPAAEALQIIYTRGPQNLSPTQRQTLIDRLGWLGELATTFGKPDNDPQRAVLLSAAIRTVVTIVVVFAGIIAAMAGGLVLLIVLLIRLADKKLTPNYHPATGGDAGSDVFLEAFAVYLGGLTVTFLAAPALPAFLQNNIISRLALMVVPTLLAMVWPVMRGVAPGAWRNGMGWHMGRGVFREIGYGLAGYLAGLPVMAAGAVLTFILISLSHATPTHPAIQHMIESGGPFILMAFLLASVYAPLTEETMFRGAFFHALRGRHGWLISAAVSSFIFAAIHPQGWTVIPTLMAIAIVFAGIREWRGTIISSAAAHCVHNTLTLTVVLMMTK